MGTGEAELTRLCGTVAFDAEDRVAVERLLRREAARLDPSRAMRIAGTHGVVPQLVTNLPDQPPGRDASRVVAEVRRLAEPYLAIRREWWRALVTELTPIAAAASREGLHLLGVKGVAMRAHYPAHSPRSTSDVDLVLLPEQAFAVIALFARAGYRPDRIRLDRGSEPGAAGSFGVAPVRPTPAAADRHRTMAIPGSEPFDLHLGHFPGLRRGIPARRLWPGNETVPLGDHRLAVAGPEACFLVLCAHAMRRGTLILQDLNDVQVLLTGDRPVDWDRVAGECRQHDVDAVASSVMARVSRRYRIEPPPPWSRRAPAPARFVRTVPLRLRDEPKNAEFAARHLSRGRLAQAAALYDERRRDGATRSASARLAVRGFAFLWRDGRAYPVWRERTPRRLDTDEHVVLVRLRPSDGEQQLLVDAVDLAAARAHATRTGAAVEHLTDDLLAWTVPPAEELVLGSCDLYAPAGYDGRIPEPDLIALHRLAWQLGTRLLAAGAVSGRVAGRTSTGASPTVATRE